MSPAGPDGTLTPDAFPVHMPLATRWRDNDSYGHVNNAVYYEFFDTAVNTWLHKRVGAEAHDGDAIGVVAASGCRYLRQAAYPEALVMGLACERLGRSSVTYRLAVFGTRDAESGPSGVTALAVGRFVHVYVSRDTRRPVPIPVAVREAVIKDLITEDPTDADEPSVGHEFPTGEWV
ncbi:thioesterase family protein [Streptomyces sp. NPDC052721]|uniref:acyl-CoA thioesterase n=1 Tax=Streptomyces sp. NPDC052721 TaxID=3154955 RepID=UPI00342DAB8C